MAAPYSIPVYGDSYGGLQSAQLALANLFGNASNANAQRAQQASQANAAQQFSMQQFLAQQAAQNQERQQAGRASLLDMAQNLVRARNQQQQFQQSQALDERLANQVNQRETERNRMQSESNALARSGRNFDDMMERQGRILQGIRQGFYATPDELRAAASALPPENQEFVMRAYSSSVPIQAQSAADAFNSLLRQELGRMVEDDDRFMYLNPNDRERAPEGYDFAAAQRQLMEEAANNARVRALSNPDIRGLRDLTQFDPSAGQFVPAIPQAQQQAPDTQSARAMQAVPGQTSNARPTATMEQMVTQALNLINSVDQQRLEAGLRRSYGPEAVELFRQNLP